MSASPHEYRVLVLAPVGRDASLMGDVLSQAGLLNVPCQDAAELRRRLGEGCGAVVLTAEALTGRTTDILQRADETQPTWSDLPLVLLVDSPWVGPDALVDSGTTTVLFRPVHPSSLVTVVRAALRARRRQFQVRDLLARQERISQDLEARVAERTAELQASHDAVVAQQTHVAAILGSISDGFAAIDRDDRLTFLNPMGEEVIAHLTGKVPQDLIGMSVWDIFPGARDSSLARRYREAVASHDPVTFETHVPSLNAWLQARAYSMGEGGLTIYMEDITERKRSEEELMRAVQEVMTDTAWFSRSLLEKIAQIRGRTRGDQASGAAVAMLTTRERQVLERMASGRDNGSIAAELTIKEQTVRNYITRIYEKLDLHSRADAIVWARERGLAGK